MSAIAKIQMIGVSKPYYGFATLSIGYHEIVRFRLVKNKFVKKDASESEQKKSILLELKDEVVFLPQYFMDNLSEDDIINLNSAEERMYLYFGGRREGSK